MSVLLVSPWRRKEGPMLFKKRLGFGWGQRAHVACGRGTRIVVAGSHRRCCGWLCLRVEILRQGRWRRREQGVRAIWRRGQRWRFGARILGSGGLRLWRVGGWTLLLLRSNGFLLQLQKRPVATWLDKFWARPFFGPSRIPYSAMPAYCPLRCRGAASLGRGKRWWCQTS